MKKFQAPAIVLGGGINGLGIVRNLGRNGVNVYSVVDKKDQIIYSRYCRKYYIIPKIQESKSILKKFLHDMGKLNGCGVLLPANDLYSLHLSELKEELEGEFYIPLPAPEVIKTLVDKKEFYYSISEYGVPHPKTYVPESSEDIKRLDKEIQYPVFVKPSMSHEFERIFSVKGFVANSNDELMKYYLMALGNNTEVIFQEVIPGLAARNIYGIESYFDKNSDPIALFAYCRLRGWPPVFGNTSLRESISLSDVTALYKATKGYLQHLKFQGLMEAEWKRDPRNGVFKLLEINARQSMQNSLPARCGINLIFIAYLDAIGEKATHVGQNANISAYEKGIRWMNFLDDLKSVIETKTSLLSWISSLKNIDEWSIFAIDDLLPWIMSNVELAKTAAKGFFRL